MWVLCVFYFLQATVTYGVFLWLTKILQDATKLGAKDFRLFLISMIPFGCAIIAMVLIGRHSDRTGERKRHVAVCALVAAAGLALAAFTQKSPAWLVLSFALCQIGQRSILAPFWAMPPVFLGGTAAAAGIALINAIGNLGGAVGPTIMGELADPKTGYTSGLLVLAGAAFVQAILVLLIRLPESRSGAVAK